MGLNTAAAKEGLLIVGHGTREAAGLREFETLVDRVAELRGGIVAGAFLELAQPDIEAGLRRVVERGARRVTVVPLLLFAAGHVQRDIPRQVAAAVAALRGVPVRQVGHLGCHPAVVRLSALRYDESLRGRSATPAEQTLLLVVGRGSQDATANAEFCQFARLRFEHKPTGWLETCYLAMTEPSLPRALAVVARLPFRRVVVQPHLLFQGELLERVGQETARAAAADPEKEYVVTDRLGPDPLLAEAVCGRAKEANWEGEGTDAAGQDSGPIGG